MGVEEPGEFEETGEAREKLIKRMWIGARVLKFVKLEKAEKYHENRQIARKRLCRYSREKTPERANANSGTCLDQCGCTGRRVHRRLCYTHGRYDDWTRRSRRPRAGPQSRSILSKE